jgi:ABC-type multidrug transport system fused ATPase/permease subunit
MRRFCCSTSPVDIQTESVIMDALAHLMAGRTTFLIAHRASTLDNCDVRITVDHGRLASREARVHHPHHEDRTSLLGSV